MLGGFQTGGCWVKLEPSLCTNGQTKMALVKMMIMMGVGGSNKNTAGTSRSHVAAPIPPQPTQPHPVLGCQCGAGGWGWLGQRVETFGPFLASLVNCRSVILLALFLLFVLFFIPFPKKTKSIVKYVCVRVRVHFLFLIFTFFQRDCVLWTNTG